MNAEKQKGIKVKTEKEEAKAETEHKEYIKKIMKSDVPNIDTLLESINTKQDEFDKILQNIMTTKMSNQLSQLKDIEKDLKKQLKSLRLSYSLIGTKNTGKLAEAEETIQGIEKLRKQRELNENEVNLLEEQEKIKAEITKIHTNNKACFGSSKTNCCISKLYFWVQ